LFNPGRLREAPAKTNETYEKCEKYEIQTAGAGPVQPGGALRRAATPAVNFRATEPNEFEVLKGFGCSASNWPRKRASSS
jgi:hypothetical protein